MDEITIVEILTRGLGCGGCCEQKAHFIIEGERDSERVREVIKEDITEALDGAFEEDKERLLLKVDGLIDTLIEDGELDLKTEVNTIWSIINDVEFTRFYFAKKEVI